MYFAISLNGSKAQSPPWDRTAAFHTTRAYNIDWTKSDPFCQPIEQRKSPVQRLQSTTWYGYRDVLARPAHGQDLPAGELVLMALMIFNSAHLASGL